MNVKVKPKLEHSMQEEQIRAALNAHWRASAVGDANAEHAIFDDDAICDYPQSGERIFGGWRIAPDVCPPRPSDISCPHATSGAFLQLECATSDNPPACSRTVEVGAGIGPWRPAASLFAHVQRTSAASLTKWIISEWFVSQA